MNYDDWMKIKDTLAEFFIIDGNVWRHKRIEMELERFKSKSEAARRSVMKRYERTTNVLRTYYERTTIQITDTDTDTDNRDKKTKEPKNLAPLDSALADFAEMRKKLKKPMTDRAMTLLKSKLDKLAKTEEEKIAILEQSILHGWQDVYALKEDGINGKVLRHPDRSDSGGNERGAKEIPKDFWG